GMGGTGGGGEGGTGGLGRRARDRHRGAALAANRPPPPGINQRQRKTSRLRRSREAVGNWHGRLGRRRLSPHARRGGIPLPRAAAAEAVPLPSPQRKAHRTSPARAPGAPLRGGHAGSRRGGSDNCIAQPAAPQSRQSSSRARA